MNSLATEQIKEILGMVPDKTATHYDASCGYYWKITSPDGDSEEVYCFSEADGLWMEEDYLYADHSLNDLREILELREAQPQWISVDDALPETYGSYDSYGKDLVVSDIVMTNHGAACYCSEHDFYQRPVWILVDWCHKEAGNSVEGVTHWMPLPEPPQERGE